MIGNPPRAALCLGHPGHELKVFGWMEKYRPLVDVITDGSGPNRESRFESTRRLIENAGGRLGFLQGAFTDREFYRLILSGDPAPFLDLASRLATEWEIEGVEVVAGDMSEGFSTTHDVCRLMINAAVIKLERRGHHLRNLEFPLDSMGLPEEVEGSEMLLLDDDGFARKRAAAIVAYPEMAGEVDRVILKFGEEAFRKEILTPAQVTSGLTWEGAEPPYYESYGRKQVEAGHYQDLIRFDAHIRPLAVALREWADSSPL